MSRHPWVAGLLLVFVLLAALMSASLSIGAPAEQSNPTQQAATLDAFAQSFFQPGPTVLAAIQATVDNDPTLRADLTATAQAGQSPNNGTNNQNGVPESRQPDGGFVMGFPDAPITVIEFGDFACPHCQEYKPTIDQFITNYVNTGKAKFEFRILPTAGGQNTYYAGQLLECAEEQGVGNFWKGYSLMWSYAAAGEYTQSMSILLVNDEGLNASSLRSCTNFATQVDTDSNLAQSLGVTGTPAVLVRYHDGKPQFIQYSGQTYDQGGVPYQVLAAVIDAAQGS